MFDSSFPIDDRILTVGLDRVVELLADVLDTCCILVEVDRAGFVDTGSFACSHRLIVQQFVLGLVPELELELFVCSLLLLASVAVHLGLASC